MGTLAVLDLAQVGTASARVVVATVSAGCSSNVAVKLARAVTLLPVADHVFRVCAAWGATLGASATRRRKTASDATNRLHQALKARPSILRRLLALRAFGNLSSALCIDRPLSAWQDHHSGLAA
jgi:hypothetical protein